MNHDPSNPQETCKSETSVLSGFREELAAVADSIVHHCRDSDCPLHVADEPIPSRQAVIGIIEQVRQILFPGYFNQETLDSVNLPYVMGQAVTRLFEILSDQITHSIRHDCMRYDHPCRKCMETGYRLAIRFLRAITSLREILTTDVQATYDGDPAAKSTDEIIFSYPGIFATAVYRVAHQLHIYDIPLLPRIMTEYAHSVTGIDIHPGAEIGERFVIDHGTGVVIGETTIIGKNVRIYQGVTLGALSLPRDAVERLKGKKRHPTIEDDVTIYSGATILGGETVIGSRSVIGGNVWITESVAPGTRVLMENPRLIYR
jgi:serine O-acetyltransferase